MEDIIRTKTVRSAPQLQEQLQKEGYDVTEETVRRDLIHVNAAKDQATGVYTLLDTQVSRFDLYQMLRHACIHLLNDIWINSSGDTVFLYPDFGTAKRFEGFLEAIRQDEILSGSRKPFHDRILAAVASDDNVVVFFENGTDGRKFHKKIQYLSRQIQDLDWVSGFEEEQLMARLESDES